MVELTDLTSLANQIDATAKINQNNAAIEAEFGEVLYRDGRTALTDNLDANGKKIINHAAPVHPTDLVRLSDLQGTEWDAEALQLRLDLGSSGGAGLIGLENGGTLQEWIDGSVLDLSTVAAWDGRTDITTALNTAFADPSFSAYYIPPGARGVISNTVVVPPGKSLDMRGALLLYTGPKDRTALQIGTSGLPYTLTNFASDALAPRGLQWTNVAGTQYLRGLAVVNVAIGTPAPDVYALSDFANANFVGIEMFNLRGISDISIYRVGGFFHGVRCVGDVFYGFTYNRFTMGWMWANRQHVTLFTNGATPDDGFITENTFYGGTFRNGSDYPNSLPAYGYLFGWNGVNSYRGHNGNLILHPSFELAASPAERIPVYYGGCGNSNRVEFARWETGNGPFMLCDNGDPSPTNPTFVQNNFALINDNVLEVGESQFGVINTNGAVANKFQLAYGQTDFTTAVNLRPVHTCVKAHSNNLVFLTDAWCGFTSPDTTIRKTLPNTIRMSRDYIEITSPDVYIGVMLDTADEKEFTIRPVVDGNFTGRLVMACFDANGDRMVTASDGRDLLAGIDWPSNRALTFPWFSGAGGHFRSANDSLSNRGATIRVTDAVASVFIGVTTGSAVTRLKALDIMSTPSKRCPGQRTVTIKPVLPASDESYATARPDTLTGTFGLYARGEEVHNFNPATGQPGNWRCSAAGWLAPAWAGSTAEALGNLKVNGSNVYMVTVAGTTASSGGPTGTGTAIVDGTVTWRYIGPRATFIAGPNIP